MRQVAKEPRVATRRCEATATLRQTEESFLIVHQSVGRVQDAVGVSAALVTRFAEHAHERQGEHKGLHLADQREQLVHAVQHEATYLGAAGRTLPTGSRVAELVVMQPRLQLGTPL